MRLIRFLLGCALLPAAVALGFACFDAFRLVCGSAVTVEGLAVSGGFLLQVVLWCSAARPVRAYVFGHELTHAVVGLLFGARVSNLKVGLHGGSVVLTKTNVWITLAPYFVPFYTVVVVLAALLVRLFVAPLPAPPVWLFLVGYTWSFHFAFTLQSLLQRQPDVEEYGHVFSYVFIWSANALGVLAAFAGTTDVTARTCARFVGARVCDAYLLVQRGGWALYELVRSLPVLQG